MTLIDGRGIAGIGLGTAPLAFREGTDAEAVATVRAALDAGIRIIDTALAYTRRGVESYAEQIVASALKGATGERPLVATKGGHWRDGDRFPVDARPATLRAHCEISLRTLGTDRIDLYFLHHVDPKVPLADSVGALAQLRQEGKIAAVGLSNVSVAQLDEGSAVTRIEAVENRLSYADPADLPTALACERRGIAYLAYAPLAAPSGRPLEAALAVAGRHDASVQRVMLAWLREQAPGIVPLVGASRPASIRDSANPLHLTGRDLADLGAARLRRVRAGGQRNHAGTQQLDDLLRVGAGECVGLDEVPGDRDAEGDGADDRGPQVRVVGGDGLGDLRLVAGDAGAGGTGGLGVGQH
jgi:aryl-alcohol dehydrogenase-like predicted oxidoreductase